ncbi:MAG: ribonuclease E activity regulator RraA, partial [Gammaproteobacteria bacterium]
LETKGEGRVLVVDAGGSMRCAVLGGTLGTLAVQNRWAGRLVNGCGRESRELAGQDVGVKALAAHPRRSEKGLHSAHADRAVTFAGVTFRPGAWLYADTDGVIVSEKAIHDAAP